MRRKVLRMFSNIKPFRRDLPKQAEVKWDKDELGVKEENTRVDICGKEFVVRKDVEVKVDENNPKKVDVIKKVNLERAREEEKTFENKHK
jgi:hypothetical protein